MKMHEFYIKNLELSHNDKVKYYLFLPQLRAYKCDELGELLAYTNNSIFDIDDECIVVETSSILMKYKALLENYEWLESINNHADKLDRCIIKLRVLDLNAYDQFIRSNYSKMYANPEILMKPYTLTGNDLSKMKANRIVKVLSHSKDYQEFLEQYLNLSKGQLNEIELDSKIQS